MTVANETRVDFLIVGARCAGASLALRLARAGARVLVVERSALPSDLVLSTHAIHPSGVRELDRLGLGDALRAATPALTTLRIVRGDAALDVPLAEPDAEYCPRREWFDALLQRAARDAGAELWDRTTAKAPVFDGGRLCGAELVDAFGRRRRVLAGRIVGADGRASPVAGWVDAPRYLQYPAARGAYWSYWRAPRGYGRCEQYPAGMYVANRTGMLLMAFHTQGDRVLVGCAPERAALPAFRAAPLEQLRRELGRDPMLCSFARAAPEEPVRGVVAGQYFLRRPVGPGWLLVGDAGIHQEFAAGEGMTSALVQSRQAAAALLAGSEAAEFEFWRERDRVALPRFFFGRVQGAAGAPARLDARLFRYCARRPGLLSRFAASFSHELSPFEVVAPGHVLRCVLAGLLAGELRVLRELAERGRLIASLRRALASEPMPARSDAKLLR